MKYIGAKIWLKLKGENAYYEIKNDISRFPPDTCINTSALCNAITALTINWTKELNLRHIGKHQFWCFCPTIFSAVNKHGNSQKEKIDINY